MDEALQMLADRFLWRVASYIMSRFLAERGDTGSYLDAWALVTSRISSEFRNSEGRCK